MAHRQFMAMVVVLLTLSGVLTSAFPMEQPRQQTGPSARTFQEDPESLYLNSTLISLKFNKTAKGGLESVKDPVTGLEFRPVHDQPPVLFQLSLWAMVGYNHIVLSNLQANNFSYLGCDDCNVKGRTTLLLSYFNFSVQGIAVNAQVEVRDGDPRSYWDISVHNTNLSWAVVEIRYPMVLGLSKDIGSNGLADTLAVPRYSGELFTDPYKLMQPPTNAKFAFGYPSELSMQFMAIYDDATAGLYLESQDQGGNVKEFFLDDTGTYSAGIGHKRPYEAATDANLPYRSVMAIFHGDWYKAADLYKGWALNTTWAIKGPVATRKDMPAWGLTPAPVVVVQRTNDSGVDKTPTEQWSEVVSAFKALTGTNITLQVQGWEQNGTYTGPFYLPPKDGDLAVKTEVKEVLVAGGHVMFSTSEGLWRLKVPQRGYDDVAEFDLVAAPYSVMNDSGSPAHDARSIDQGMPAAVMDPTTEYWHDMDVSASKGIATDVVDIQELQDLPYGAWEPCYNPAHAHDQGYSSQTTIAHRTVLTDSLYAARSVNPDFMLTTEGPSEPLLDLAQAYRAGDDAPERGPYLDDMNAYGSAVSTAPMYSYVYHGYTTAYGTPVPIGGLDMPGLYNSSARAIARSYVLGELPSVTTLGTSTGNQKLSTLYAREAKAMATYARDYLWLGTMLPPPAVQAIDAEIPYRLDPREGHEGAGWGKDTDRQVLSSAWLSPEGKRLGVAMVNWGNSTLEIGMFLQPYGLTDQDYTLVLTRNGERSTIAASVRLPHSMTVTMGPRDVVLIEALHGPDIVIEDLTVAPSSVVVGGTVNVTVSVANRGSESLGNIHVQLYENGTYKDDSAIGQLGPDANVSIPFTWSSDGKALGTYNLTAKVWPFYGELSTANNLLSEVVSVLPVPRGTVSCAVVDNSTKASLPGASVVLFDVLNGTSLAEGVTVTNHDVLFPGLLPGTYGLNVTKNGYFPFERTDIAVTGDKTTYVTVYMVPVPPVVTTGEITGAVVDNTTKEPLAGAKVTVVDLGINYTTLTDGLFDFQGVEAGLHALSITKAGYIGTNLNANVTAGRTTYLYVNLTAKPPPAKVGDIVGTVQNERTKLPIADALLNLTYTGSGPDIGSMEMTTDAQGAFQFSDVPLGPYSLNATAQGFIGVDIPVNVSIEGANLVSVNLRPVPVPPPPTVTLKGFITDKDGHPLKAARVATVGAAQASTNSDGTGYYQLTGLKPGTFVVNVTLDGYQDLARTVSPTAGGDLWLNITMEKRPKTGGVAPELTYLLVGLNLLMLVGIIAMLATGTKRSKDRPRRVKGKKIKKVAVRRVRRPAAVSEEE